MTMVRDRKWLDHVREMNCMICNATPCDPAHIRVGGGGGIGMKPHDNHVVPLCHEHHREQHQIGERRFWSEACQRDPDLALRLLRAYARELYKMMGLM